MSLMDHLLTTGEEDLNVARLMEEKREKKSARTR